MLSQEAPDLVLLGGDFISESPRFARDAAAALGELATMAPLGCLAVLGNHDISTDRPRITALLEDQGIRVLCNEAVHVETAGGPLWIAGIDETILGRPDVDATFAAIPSGAAVIALWHEPDNAEQASAAGAFAQLSGHSHGGQIRLPGVGPLVLPPGGRRFPAGHYALNGLHLYTSRGVGVYRPPVRLFCPPEVTIVTLTTSQR
jgi:predicted MPP superfamily phosphohydrolase